MKALIASTLLILPLAAFSADKSPDAAFYKHAAEGGISEVELGTLAQDKATSQDVKDFAAMMVKDHGAADDKLKTIADSKSIALPNGASIGDIAIKAKLNVLSGETFDKSYIKSQLKAHREAIALFRQEASSGQDPDAKAFAAATLPTLREHLKAIRRVAASAGMSSKKSA
jgi:putative membrane protein